VVAKRLQVEHPGSMYSWSDTHIQLAPWALAVAEQLHRQFGDSVILQVGVLRYPPSRQPGFPPDTGRFPERLIPDELVVELDGPAVLRSGHTLRHDLLVCNPTGLDAWVAFGNDNAVVVDRRTGEIVGGWAGGSTLEGHIVRVPPGHTGRVPLLIGTASFTPALGYAVPPGQWGVQGLLRVVLDRRGPDRPTFMAPPGSPNYGMPVPPPPLRCDPEQRTPILPLTITA
jgi:hypothetical protein